MPIGRNINICRKKSIGSVLEQAMGIPLEFDQIPPSTDKDFRSRTLQRLAIKVQLMFKQFVVNFEGEGGFPLPIIGISQSMSIHSVKCVSLQFFSPNVKCHNKNRKYKKYETHNLLMTDQPILKMFSLQKSSLWKIQYIYIQNC